MVKEISYILLGEQRNGIWHGRLNWRASGSPASVEFDWERVLSREEKYGDIIGFFHTHPGGMHNPSNRDDKTMHAWSNSFGKPLLCIIEASKEVGAWIYDYRKEGNEKVDKIERFRSNWLVAIERLEP